MILFNNNLEKFNITKTTIYCGNSLDLKFNFDI